MCGDQTLNDECLLTVLTEAERILNNRPIVPLVSEDPESAALTPNHLLLLRDNDGIEMKCTSSELFKARWRQANHLAAVFWKRWIQEYLPTLQARQKWLFTAENFKIGDVVLIRSGCLQKGLWPLGIIEKCYPGADGLVRKVEVRTRGGTIVRDIRQLCRLEGDTPSNIGSAADAGEVGIVTPDSPHAVNNAGRERDVERAGDSQGIANRARILRPVVSKDVGKGGKL